MVDFENEVDAGRTAQVPPINPLRGLAGSAADVASDAASLFELQVKLAREDFKETTRRLRLPLTLAVLGGSGLIASLPVLMQGAASGLATATGMSVWLAQLVAAGCLAFVAAVVTYLSARGFRSSLAPLHRSCDELTSNLAWLRSTLTSHGSESRHY